VHWVLYVANKFGMQNLIKYIKNNFNKGLDLALYFGVVILITLLVIIYNFFFK
jgi:hypothetical protein